jgi:hypothetical protein
MRTDRRAFAALLRQLRDYLQRVTEQADNEARTAGLSVEVLAGGVHRYRDARMDQLAVRRAARGRLPYGDVRDREARRGEQVDVGVWSAPTLVASATRDWSQ